MGRKEGKEGVVLRKREEKEKLSALSTKSQGQTEWAESIVRKKRKL